MNVILVGAKKAELCDNDARLWNNVEQASHTDLIYLKDLFCCDVTCYDPGYTESCDMDGITYLKDIFYFDCDYIKEDKVNVIVEFSNMLDENYINHGLDNAQHNNLMKCRLYKIVVLACGCSWNKGFPIQCISYLYDSKFYTPCDPYYIDNLLYVISCTSFIQSLEEEKRDVLYPYRLGLYQCMGTMMWRGCETDGYKSENVMRELFGLIGTDCIDGEDLQKEELIEFINGNKHWNTLSWDLRKALSKFVYGMH